MANFTKVSYTNASPKGTGDLRLGSIPAKAKHLNDHIDELLLSNDGRQNVNVAEASDAVTITSMASGNTYYAGTTTGIAGATDAAQVYTFKLPTPKAAGERIRLYWTNAAVIAKIVGVVTTVPASQYITYYAYAQQVFIETAKTAAGVNGTANTMVKVAASSTIFGDIWDFTSMSTTQWRMDINDATNVVEAGDIVVDPGNVGGYID